MDSDRRRHPRLYLRVELDFACESNFYRGQTRDISAGGLFIETSAKIPLGTIISVDLRFLKRNLRVKAEAMWELRERGRLTGIGFQFVELPDSARRAIEAFMTLRQPLHVDA